ncbi:hypothetical protein E1193_25205 [Micromonospora sp. KC606]|uniref:hypothetical protein n=1 Tax=Micromonospora sp. KC606 TaxID=2530379 RepID=UPI001043B37A|nr:hypothetical protein [Micromonospora sp. KC606]TDC75637.1 hypothetical protein E1193_25205 [Micromonospora sp. KC606]
MRIRLCLAVSAVLLTATGCADAPAAVPVPPVEPLTIEVAAASSGGACRLLDFAVIEEHTGVRFDVAAAGDRADTHTCVVRAGAATLPELTLTVTDTSIDAPTFNADVLPRGAAKVTKLGQVAYRRTVAKNGPVAEVGWLAAEGRLATLHWTCEKGTAKAEVEELTGKLVELAKRIDTRSL